MPLVNLQNFPFVDGTTPDADQIMDDLYDPVNPATSFEAINGALDNVNADPSWALVQQNQIQENTFTDARAVAGTANLDWFPRDWWTGQGEDINASNVTAVDPQELKALPGGNQTFYLQWDSVVVFTWSVHWGGELWENDLPAHVIFILDGEWDIALASQRRSPRSMWRNSDTSINAHWGEVTNRFWHGHVTVNLPAGWHTAGLHLIAAGSPMTDPADIIQSIPSGQIINPFRDIGLTRRKCGQVRVWVRSFNYVAFRGQDNG